MKYGFHETVFTSSPNSLKGQMLIAMPGMNDPRFSKSLIYMCAHSEDGAMGIVVNKPAPGITFAELLRQVEILPEGAPAGAALNVQVHFGGPVEMGRGFVLHSTDYFSNEATMPIDDGIGLTATLEVLRAIAEGRGPSDYLLALGYAGWSPGQLEAEIRANGWLNCEADPALVFARDLDEKYKAAFARLGIEPGSLSSDAGHA
jgi:putative transcriptional regulator